MVNISPLSWLYKVYVLNEMCVFLGWTLHPYRGNWKVYVLYFVSSVLLHYSHCWDTCKRKILYPFYQVIKLCEFFVEVSYSIWSVCWIVIYFKLLGTSYCNDMNCSIWLFCIYLWYIKLLFSTLRILVQQLTIEVVICHKGRREGMVYAFCIHGIVTHCQVF